MSTTHVRRSSGRSIVYFACGLYLGYIVQVAAGKKKQLPPRRPVELIERVVAGDEKAWQLFVEAHAGFLYSLAWRYARGDVDLAAELVLVALEGLRRADAEGRPFYRLRKYLDSIERFGRRSRFVTWLALVVKNLLRDWFRAKEGRRLLPREIEQLDPRGQAVFRALLWDGLSESEAFASLRSRFLDLDHESFDCALEQVYSVLKERNLWNIYQDLLRRLPSVLVDESGRQAGVQLADPHPKSRPDTALEHMRRLQLAGRIGRLLHKEIEQLPDPTRRVVQLLLLRGLAGEQVRRVMGFRKRQRVYDEMAKARRRIRKALEREGVTAGDVREATGLLHGWLEKENSIRSSRSAADGRPESEYTADTTNEEV